MRSAIFNRILQLIVRREVVISDHGYEELLADDILIRDIMAGAAEGRVIEEYPTYHKGPCVLVLQRDHDGEPIHVVWGIPSGATFPAVVITAYRPEPSRRSEDFTRRRS